MFVSWTCQVDEVSAMHSFVEYLTSEMHRQLERSEVIWYDSVTRDGELKWQNELNDHNRCFFVWLDSQFQSDITWNSWISVSINNISQA